MTTMIEDEDGIDKIIELAGVQHAEIGGKAYVSRAHQVVRLRRPEEVEPAPLEFCTLAGLAEYIGANPDGLPMDEMVLHVASFEKVRLLGKLQPGNDNARFSYAVAEANRTRDLFPFGQWMWTEDLIIRLQTDFARPNVDAPAGADDPGEDDADDIIELVGKIANENIQTETDNGFTQSVQVRSGLTTLSTVRVENPVRLHPWRSFTEIAQPRTLAVLRFRPASGPHDQKGSPSVALFESGSGAWQLEAMARVRAWLINRLPGFKVLA